MKFVNVAGRINARSSGCKNFNWATWTCTLGWQSVGIHPDAQYQEIHTVCRSHSEKIIASGDNNGRVNLFRYPACIEKSSCKAYIGHSSHITKVKFLYNDTFIISTGGNDKCILVWETDFGNSGEKQQTEEILDESIKYNAADFVPQKIRKGKYKVPEIGESKSEFLFKEEKTETGDQFMAIKPWLGAIKAPSGFTKPPLNQNKAPQVELALDHVFGYRAK